MANRIVRASSALRKPEHVAKRLYKGCDSQGAFTEICPDCVEQWKVFTVFYSTQVVASKDRCRTNIPVTLLSVPSRGQWRYEAGRVPGTAKSDRAARNLDVAC